jgi:hypothetical protein
MKKLAWFKGLTVSLSVLFALSVSLVHAGPIKFGADFTGATPFTGNVTITAADPALIFDVETATDTDFWIGVTEDAGSDDDDLFQIGDGTTPGTNPFLTVDTSGQVGIGIAAPLNPLHVEVAKTGAGANFPFRAEQAVGFFNNTETTKRAIGVFGQATATAESGVGGYFLGNLYGVYADTDLTRASVTGVASYSYAIDASVTERLGYYSATGVYSDDGGNYTMTRLYSDYQYLDVEAYAAAGSIAITNLRGVNIDPYTYTDSGASITITTQVGVYIADTVKDGTANTTITTQYGIRLEAMTAGATNYALYSAGGQSYHAGNFGIGITVPTAKAHVAQSSTSGAIPVLTLDQADVDEDYVKVIGTSDTSVDRALVDAANFTTPGAIAGWLKINVQDDQGTGPIADGDYYIPFYAAPTS